MSTATSENRLRRLQWAVRLTLALGVAASVTANVLHAQPNLISQAIAAWPPVALLIAVELVSRVPIHRRWLGVIRIGATFAIAVIAAWVSWHHMAAVVARYGETGAVPYLLPLSVDGLIVVASVSLVELAGRRRDTAAPHEPEVVGLDPIGDQAENRHSDFEVDRSTGPSREGVIEGERAADHHDADHAGERSDEEELAVDLVSLLPAARTARDELAVEGRTVSRDALARRMRRNGHSIRNNRVSELLTALREETPSPNGSRSMTAV